MVVKSDGKLRGKNMKNIQKILPFLLLILIFSCKGIKNDALSDINLNTPVDIKPVDIKKELPDYFSYNIQSIENNIFYPKETYLMPYLKKDEGFGYINSETFEIVIPAQYSRAGDFHGGYAVVSKSGEDEDEELCIINKKNEKILSGFDVIGLYDNEDGSMVFALTANYSGESFYNEKGRSWPQRIDYKIYNLAMNNIVIKEGAIVNTETKEKSLYGLSLLGNYMYMDSTNVYEIKNNGTLEKTNMTVREVVTKVAKERGLRYNEYDFDINFQWHYDIYFNYMHTLDMELLTQNVPENIRVIITPPDKRNRGYRDSIESPTKPLLRIEPFNYTYAHPLKNNSLFEVELETIEDGEKYICIYDSFTNKWVVPMIKKGWETYFLRTSYNDWVISDNHNVSNSECFYNIRTRKKYYNFYSNEYYGLTYMGYYEPEMEFMVEDF